MNNNNYHYDEPARFKEILKEMDFDGQGLYAGGLLERAAQLYPQRIALIYEDQRITFRQLYFHACEFASRLQDAGVEVGDRVIISMHNSLSFYAAYFAVWHLGAVVAPINTFLIEKELEHIIADAQPKVMIVDKEREAMFAAVSNQTISLLTDHDVQAGMHVSDGIMQSVARGQDELCALLYTSGTTGMPKGVMLSSRNIMTNIAQVLSRVTLEYDDNDRIL